MGETIPGHLRPLAYEMSGLMHNMLRLMRAAVHDDLEAALITVCVANASMRKFMATCGPGSDELRRARLPEEALGSVSRRLIAEKTNLPRETVRRKASMLIENGILRVGDDGAVRIAQRLHLDDMQQALCVAHNELSRLVSALDSYGIGGASPESDQASVDARAPVEIAIAPRGGGEEDIDPRLFPMAFGLSELVFDCMYYMREMFGEDLDRGLIMVVANEATMRPFIKDMRPDSPIATVRAPPEEIRGSISRRLIADQTGLARETVRRKIARLIEEGLLLADDEDAVRAVSRLHHPDIQKSLEDGYASVRKYLKFVRAYGVN